MGTGDSDSNHLAMPASLQVQLHFNTLKSSGIIASDIAIPGTVEAAGMQGTTGTLDQICGSHSIAAQDQLAFSRSRCAFE